jgi:hypothetical protein
MITAINTAFTNESSNLGQDRELPDSELAAIAGGSPAGEVARAVGQGLGTLARKD